MPLIFLLFHPGLSRSFSLTFLYNAPFYLVKRSRQTDKNGGNCVMFFVKVTAATLHGRTFIRTYVVSVAPVLGESTIGIRYSGGGGHGAMIPPL